MKGSKISHIEKPTEYINRRANRYVAVFGGNRVALCGQVMQKGIRAVSIKDGDKYNMLNEVTCERCLAHLYNEEE